MLIALNHTFLVLILKSPTPMTLHDYRPISCIGVAYKVISKLITNHLLTTLPNLIAKNQFAFIKGRRISDAINLAHEFTHTFNYSGMSQRAFIIINFTKAFDSLWWDSIEVGDARSFGVQRCLSTYNNELC